MKNFTQEAQEAKGVLAKEALAIQGVADRLIPKEFSKAIDILFKKDGKIIVTGIGKSGHVGKKFAAMLCSTGSPTAFLHPSEAVHGDLGIHQEGDPVIFLSNSGSTPELLYLEPVFRARGAKIIGILGKQQSPLGEKVDVILDASVNEEADPLGIVPTSSFAAASALGDAIGSALMKRRNFDSKEYAKTHPAGQLGRNLILKVRDVFHPFEKVACLAKKDSIKQAVIEMSKHPLGAACILEDKKLIGIITDGDLKRLIRKNNKIDNLIIKKHMSKNPYCVEENILASDILTQMNKRKITNVCVFNRKNRKKTIGVVHIHDVINNLR